MELIIFRNNEIIGYMSDNNDNTNDSYSIQAINNLPICPEEELTIGFEWKLVNNNGTIEWTKVERPLTNEELLQKRLDEALLELEQYRLEN